MTKLVYLVVISGPLQGHKYLVKEDCLVVIGRSEEAHIRIAYDNFCSRKHAFVCVENGICSIRDLGSKNGTRVNNIPIKEQVKLNNGDIINLGNTNLQVVYTENGENKKMGLDDEVKYED